MGSRSRAQLVRQWELVRILSEHPRGLRSVQLAKELDTSRASVDRDLTILREAGFAIRTETVGGEKRHTLSNQPLPPLQPTPLQMVALRLAVSGLMPLEGTQIVEELRALIGVGCDEQTTRHISLVTGPGNPAIVKTIDRAIASRHRVRLQYQAASHQGSVRTYELEPLQLRLAKQDLYLVAYDLGSEGLRCFKILRVLEAELQNQKARTHSELDVEAAFANSIKAWGGDHPHTVTVRLKPELAWLAKEYPLAQNQKTEKLPDGSLELTAQLTGLTEVKQWILGWGAGAVAVAPKELRDAVRTELEAAVRSYQGPRPSAPAGVARVDPSRAARKPGLAATRQTAERREIEAPATRSAHRR